MYDDVGLRVSIRRMRWPRLFGQLGDWVKVYSAADLHDALCLAGVGNGEGLAPGLCRRRPVPDPALAGARGRERGDRRAGCGGTRPGERR